MYHTRSTPNANGVITLNISLERCIFYKDYFVVFCLFVGLVTSAYFSYNFPLVRLLSVFFICLYLGINFLKNVQRNLHLFLFQWFIFSFIIFQLLLNQVRLHDSDIAPFLAIFFAAAYYNKANIIFGFLKFVLIINFLVMLYEHFSFEYLIQIVEENKYEPGRMQGVFSYSKEAGYFLLVAFLYLRYFKASFLLLLLVAFSTVLSGSRTAILFVFFVLMFDLFVSMLRISNIQSFAKYIFVITLSLMLSFVIYTLYFTADTVYILNRINNSFDFQSSSHIDRLYFWSQYLSYINAYSLSEFIFGAGTRLNVLIGNGAENTYLMILSQFGLLGLLLFIFPFVGIIMLAIKYPYQLYPFVLLLAFLFVGRLSVGWADGILMWVLIFLVLSSKLTLNCLIVRQND